nr:hypothetical protein CR513_31848 [Ipomoea trifida]
MPPLDLPSVCYWVCTRRKLAASHFAAYPYFDVLYFLCTPVSFPVAAFWWNPTIFLELSLENNKKTTLKDQKMDGLAPLANAVERALGGVDGGRRQKGRRELEHLVLHQAKLDQEEGHELELLVGLSRLQEPLHEHIWSRD